MSELMRAVATKENDKKENNDKKILELLAKKDIKLDEADEHGNTPLNYACAMGRSEEIILKMISMGASCKIANKNGARPLNHAVYSGMSPNVLKAIVDAGGDVNYQNESGGTALQVACICKAGLVTVQTLVEDLAADPDLANHNGNTPLMFAIRNHNDISVVEYLAGKVKNINAQTTKEEPKYPGFTALHFAAGERLPAHAAILITHGAELPIQNEEGFTALQLADEKTKTAMMSSSFAKFSMSTPAPVVAPAVRRSTMQPEDTRVSVKRAPLRRTSMLAGLASGSNPAPSSTPPSEPMIDENDDLKD
jgi:ankyrin repeat protein